MIKPSTPFRFIAVIIGGLFLSEMISNGIIWVFGIIDSVPYFWLSVIDSTLTILLSTPLLYYYSVRPLLSVISERETEIAWRKKVESQLRIQDTALETAANGVFITDALGNILWVNPAFTQITGYTLDEALGQNPRLFQSGQQDKNFYHSMWETILSGQVWRGEVVNRRKDGRLFYEEQTITPLVNEKGEVTSFVAVQHDISERKQAEQVSQRSEALLRKVLENMPVGVVILDQNGLILQANAKSEEIWAGLRYVGIEQYGEYKGWWLDSGKPIALDDWAAARAVAHGEIVLDEEVEIECFDGTHKVILNSAVPIFEEEGAIQGVIVVNQDITVRKRAEMALHESEQKFRTLVDWTYDWEEWIDPQGNIIYTSPSCERISGYLPAEFMSDPDLLTRIVHPDDRKSYEEHKQLIHDETAGVINLEYRIIARDGTEHWIDHICRPLFGKDNLYLGRRVSNRDITERKQAEEQLANRNKELIELTNSERKQRQTAETLLAAAQSLTQTLRLERVVDSLLDHINKIIPFDTASVALLEDETRLELRAVRGNGYWAAFNALLANQLTTNPLIQNLFSSCESILIPKLVDHPAREIIPAVDEIQSWLVAPIVIGDKAIGVMWFGKKEPGFFDRKHVELTEALAGQAGVAIQNARLFDQVRAGRERLQNLSKQLVEIHENERRYIARELHDEIGQILTSLMLGLEMLRRDANQPEAIIAGIAELNQIVEKVLEEIHRLAVDLRPASLDRLGLVPALHQHIETLSNRYKLMFNFETVGIKDRLPSEIETALYRIVQEALTNVIRHAHASRVDISLEEQNERISLVIQDNGVGFDPATQMQPDRLGLFGLRERAELLNGRLSIESSAGKGTTIIVEVPYVSADSSS